MDVNAIYELAQKLETESMKICAKLISKPIVILPAGRFTYFCLEALEKYDISVEKIADNARGKWGKKINVLNRTYEITSVDDVVKECGNDCNYMIISKFYREEIAKQLKKEGIAEKNIFDAPVYIGELQEKNSFLRKMKVKEYEKEINNALSCLHDDASKQQLITLLAISIVNGLVFMNGQVREEYFNIPYFALEENEIFVDGGMYDGETTRRFIELCPTYSQVYGYEANEEQIKIIEENLKQFECVTIFKNALYFKPDKLYFKTMGEGSCLDNNGTMIVEAISIDECNINPTYVKLDIEGAEYAALEGMKETVARCSPKLAVAIYHSLEDHWRLINKIKEMDPEYNIAVMHHYAYDILYGSNLYAWK